MVTPISSDVLNQEADVRFWAQTGYKPGHKLDPNNPTDRAMAPVWMDVFRKVQGEAKTGVLVTTYDHPRVARALSDAKVAGQAAAIHVAAATETPDPLLAQDNVAAATTASQISIQRARDAAADQRPTVNPELVRKAGQEVAGSPPPPQAAPAEHIAHVHVRDHAHSHSRGVHAQARAALYKETNNRFWTQTGYKTGQSLDMVIEQDRKMAKVWMDIFHQVQREADAGTLTRPAPATSPTSSSALPPVVVPPRAAPPPPAVPPPAVPQPSMRPPMAPHPSMGPPRPMGPWMGPPMGPPMGPWMGPWMDPSRGPLMGLPRAPRPPTGPSMGPPMAQRPPTGPSMGLPTESPAGPPMGPLETPTPGAPGGGSSGLPVPAGEPSSGAPGEMPPPPTEEPSGVGKYIAIGLAVIAGGGLLYYATTRLPSREPPARPRARRTFVPPRAPRAASAAMVRSMPAQGGSELELEE